MKVLFIYLYFSFCISVILSYIFNISILMDLVIAGVGRYNVQCKGCYGENYRYHLLANLMARFHGYCGNTKATYKAMYLMILLILIFQRPGGNSLCPCHLYLSPTEVTTGDYFPTEQQVTTVQVHGGTRKYSRKKTAPIIRSRLIGPQSFP